MKVFARCCAVAVASILALAVTMKSAKACSGDEAKIAGTLSMKLLNSIPDRNWQAGEKAYQDLLALDASCVNAFAHTNGGTVARRRGDIHNALLRFTTAGNTAEVAKVNQAYGIVRINASNSAPRPRVLTWVGIGDGTNETAAVLAHTQGLINGPTRVVGYLPPGRYFIRSGQTTLLDFEVKAGQTLMLQYP